MLGSGFIQVCSAPTSVLLTSDGLSLCNTDIIISVRVLLGQAPLAGALYVRRDFTFSRPDWTEGDIHPG